VDRDAIEAILDLAEDVPYNVQRLAHECFSALRDEDQTGEERRADGNASGRLTAARVERVLGRLVERDDPFYTQTWNQLTATQKKALLALTKEGGRGLFAKEVLAAYELPLSTMRTALEALQRVGIAREEENRASTRLRLEDPFFAAWLERFVAGP